MLLLVTNSRDLTTDLIVHEVQARGLRFRRLNTDRLHEARPAFGIVDGRFSFTFQDRGETVDLAGVTAAYLRRPQIIGQATVTSGALLYSVREWSALLEGLYSGLTGRWPNEPRLMQAAEDKITQLRVAASIGFHVPATVVTNDPAAMNALMARSPCVAKPLRNGLNDVAGGSEVIFTTRVTTIPDADFGDVLSTPFIVQHEVEKDLDVRVTVVGRTVFAVGIASQGDEAGRTDWRRGDASTMPHVAIDLPPDTNAMCVALVEALGLRYGAIDLVRDREGKDWFLEVNPNGQWGWIQARTGQPIAGAIVDALVDVSAS